MPIFLLLILCRKIMCGVDGGVFQNQSKTYHNRAFCTQSTYHNHASKRCGSLQTRRLAMIGLVFFTDACLGRWKDSCGRFQSVSLAYTVSWCIIKVVRGYYQQFCFGALALCSAKQSLFGTNSSPLEQNRVCLGRTPTRWCKTGSVWDELRPADAKQGLFGANSDPLEQNRVCLRRTPARFPVWMPTRP